MKKLYVFILLLMLSISTFAQSTTDTVFIHQDQALEVSNIINADTSVTDYRVYVFDRGAKYFIVNAFEINSSSKFVSVGDESLAPATFLTAIRADDSQEEWFFKFIQTDIEVEMDGLYLLSMRPDGKTLGWSRGAWVGADGIKLTVRNCVFDGWSECALKVTSKDYSIDVQDSHFRNMQHTTSYYGGQPFLTDGLPFKTIKFVNNTFFANNSYIFCVRDFGDEAIFEHNTVVDGVVNGFLTRLATNIFVKNNLFVNSHAYVGTPNQTVGGWFNDIDSTTSGVLRIARKTTYAGQDVSGPEAYNDTINGLFFDPSTWTNVAVNNAHYTSAGVVDGINAWNDTVATYDTISTWDGNGEKYVKRTIQMPSLLSPFSQSVYDDLQDPENPAYSPNVKCEGNITDQDPGFTNPGVVAHDAELVNYMYEIAGSSFDNEPWHYEEVYDKTTGEITWPLPESFEYTNTVLQSAGDDGYAVGDLNWFPEQKEAWLNDPTDVKEVNTVADKYTLSQNYPNPFNPTTTIDFSIPKQATVSMKVFNVLGQQVTELVNKEMAAGTYKVSFDASKLTSGVYFYTIQAGDFTSTKKMMLLK